MNDRNPLIYIIGALLACLVCISVFVGDGNLLANLFFYLIIGGGILACMSPKAGFILCLLSCFFVDLAKRLLVVSDRVQTQDLYYVLGFPPLVFSIVLISLLARGMVGKSSITRWNLMMFVLACIVALINAAFTLLQGNVGISQLLQNTANGGLYAMLLFVVPLLYPKTDDVLRLFKILLWIFVPVAIYGVIQQVWGFREFEILYLQTGRSIEEKQLLTDRVRAFSTLNSPTSLGAISAALMMVPLFLATTRRVGGRLLSIPLALLFTGSFAAALMASTSRSGIIIIAVCLAGLWCFRSRLGTVSFYVVMLIAFATLLVGATYFQDRLNDMSERLIALAGSQFSEDTLSINTFSDRLRGFSQVLTNPDAYSLFGYGSDRGNDPGDPLYNHDILSNILVHYGVIALGVVVVPGTFLLLFIHRSLLRIRDSSQRRIGAMMLALAIGLVAISVASGGILNIFPVNIIFWLAVTAAMQAARSAQTAVQPAAAPAHSGMMPHQQRSIPGVLPTPLPSAQRRFRKNSLPCP